MPVRARARRLAVVVIALVASLPLLASPASAEDPPPAQSIATRVVVGSTNFRPVYGQSFTMFGQVQISSDGTNWAPFPNQPVRLDVCTAGCSNLATATWAKVADGTTGAAPEARFSFTQVARGTKIYRVVFDGSKYLGLISSAAQGIKIGTFRRVDAALRQPRPGVFRLKGRVTPLYGGQKVALMRRTCMTCGFTWVKNVTATSTGYYSISISRPSRTTQYVARAIRSRNLETSYSKIAQITVR